MFEVYRFKRYFKAFKKNGRNEAGEWEITMQDVRVLLDKLPLSVVRKFGQVHVKHLRNFQGAVYHENIDDLLDAVRQAAVSIRTSNYLDPVSTEIISKDLSSWVQATPVACNFGMVLSDFRQAFGELVDAYNTAPPEKAGYYQRRTYTVVCDVMSLTELMAELIMSKDELHA